LVLTFGIAGARSLYQRDSLLLPGAAGLVLACLVVALHMLLLGYDLSVFVRAAPPFSASEGLPPSLRLLQPDQSYDGQYYYRLALDPGLTRDVSITLDKPAYRQQRLLYPLLARVLALGLDDWVPASLLLVNVLGLGVLGVLGALYARDLGLSPWYGLGLTLFPGFAFTLARDLAEILEACLLVGCALALRRDRSLAAGVLLALAVLTRETAVVLAATLLVVALWSRLRKGYWPAALTAAGLGGLACFVVVQASVGLRWGGLPVLNGSANLAWPFSAPLQYVTTVGPLGRIEFAWFAAVAASALLSRPTRAPLVGNALRLSLLPYLGLLVTLSWLVWAGDVAWLRAATEAFVLAWLVLLHGNLRRVQLALLATAALWPFVARWAIST
jgi:hypothetical protein